MQLLRNCLRSFLTGLVQKPDERSPGLQRKSHVPELASSIAWLRSLRPIARVIVAVAQLLCLIAAPIPVAPSARAQTAARPPSIDRFAKFIEEASARFAVPARWIRAVMQVESAGDEHAISSRGAMGLMQLMPGTWVELSVRYGLGLDPLIRATTFWRAPGISRRCTIASDRQASLRPTTRVRRGIEQHLATGQPLPPETMAYVAAVTPLLADEQGEQRGIRIRRAVPWREAPLFVDRADAP